MAYEPRYPDHLGHQVHEEPLRQSLWCLGLQVGERLVTELDRPLGSWLRTSSGPHRVGPRSAKPLGNVAVFDDHFANGLAFLERLLGDGGSVLISDVAVQRRDDGR